MKISLPIIDALRHSFGYSDNNNYSKKSYELIDKIYDVMSCLQNFTTDEGKRIYVRYERGSFEDYAEMHDIDISTKRKYNQRKKEFLTEYFMEYNWVEVRIYKYKDYRTMLINESILFTDVPKDKRKGLEDDISEILEDLYERICISITLLKNNTYYEKLCNEIGYNQRTGIMKLDDFFTLNENCRKEYYKYLSQDDIDLFLKKINEQIKYEDLVEEEASKYRKDVDKYFKILNKKYDFVERIKTMTSTNYYDICKICYQSINLEGVAELSSKELFYKYADGRDFELKNINPNSCEEFEKWVEVAHDHAFEIRMGSSTTRIDLWVYKDEKGYCFLLSGKYLWNSCEVIKFYVELIKNNIPTYLFDASVIRDRLVGKGLIGIVPYTVFPRYCQSGFAEEVNDFMHLPNYPNEYEQYLKYIKWQEIPNTYLKGE